MFRILIFFFTGLFFQSVHSQVLAPGKYWIQLTDKNNSNYSIHHPEEFLSERAIERRLKHNIPVTEEDIPVVKEYIDSIQQLGVKILGTSKWMNSVIISSSDTLILNNVSDLDFVEDFNPAKTFRIPTDGILTCNNTGDNNTNHFPFFDSSSDYGQGFKQIHMLNGKALHNLGYRGKGIRIGVFDAGFYRVNSLDAFRHLWDGNRIIEIKDFINIDSDVFTESTHGMSAISTMAAFIPGEFIGTAPEAEYVLIRSEDVSSEFKIEEVYWLMAAEFADSAGVDIISSSLGYSEFNDTTMNYSYADLDGETALVTIAAEKAFSKGMIVVVSAGNEGNKTWNKITAPSDGRNVLSVGAVDTLGIKAAFSSRGPSYDGRVKPDIMAVGYETTIINSSGLVGSGYGTSFAAPQISGLTACLWQSFPERSNSELIQAILKSSDKYSNPDYEMGYGIPNFMLAYHLLSGLKNYEHKICIFPNPFTHDFNLYFDIPVQEIRIIDMLGNVVAIYKLDLQPFELKNIQIPELLPGIYLVTGRNIYEQRTSRLIKQ